MSECSWDAGSYLAGPPRDIGGKSFVVVSYAQDMECDDNRVFVGRYVSACVLFGLSLEQGVKSLSCRRKQDKSFFRTHNLECLWGDLDVGDKDGVARKFTSHVKEFEALGWADRCIDVYTRDNLTDFFSEYNSVFEDTRYITDIAFQGGKMLSETELRVLALSVCSYNRYGVAHVSEEFPRVAGGGVLPPRYGDAVFVTSHKIPEK